MMSRDIYPQARTLYVLLPDPTITGAVGDAETQYTVADRLIEACQQAGVDELDATIIGEALAGYLYGWSSRYGTPDDMIGHAQAALNIGAGGEGDHLLRFLPLEARVTVPAIAYMIAGVLVLDLEEGEGATP
jgi:hypothetical protein